MTTFIDPGAIVNNNQQVPIKPQRRKTRKVWVGNVPVGGGSPVSVQTMTKTKTDDIQGTIDDYAFMIWGLML